MKRESARPLMGRPTVSVVVPCYNYGHFLPIAVGSALDQPGINVDILIVDDASPDGSVEVAHKLAALDPRVKVLAHKTNEGHIATYKDGLDRAEGDYVVLLSADDMVSPGSFTRSAALMEAHPEVVLTYGYTVDFTELAPAPDLKVRNWSIWTGPEWIARLYKRGNNVVVNPEAMLRTCVMHDVGGYDPDLPHAADMLLWMQCALRGGIGRVNGPDQAYYRNHGANMHLTDYAGLMTDLRERRKAFERLLGDPSAAHLDRPHLNASARRAMARESLRLGCQAFDQGGTHGGADFRQFAEFAIETWPMVETTPAWRALQRRISGPIPAWRVAAFTRARWVTETARWRRWRRYGT